MTRTHTHTHTHTHALNITSYSATSWVNTGFGENTLVSVILKVHILLKGKPGYIRNRTCVSFSIVHPTNPSGHKSPHNLCSTACELQLYYVNANRATVRQLVAVTQRSSVCCTRLARDFIGDASNIAPISPQLYK